MFTDIDIDRANGFAVGFFPTTYSNEFFAESIRNEQQFQAGQNGTAMDKEGTDGDAAKSWIISYHPMFFSHRNHRHVAKTQKLWMIHSR